jgi:hypothetical protein
MRLDSSVVCVVLVAFPWCTLGCSAGGADETAVSATSGALVVVDPALAAAAQVSADSVSFPASGMATLASHRPGDLLVSPRVVGSQGNTTGFLRKVASTSTEGDRVVVATTAASLSDAIPEGDVVRSFHVPAHGGSGSDGGDGIDFDDVVIADLTEDLGTWSSSLRGNTLQIKATLDSAHLGFTPDVDFSMSFSGGHLKKLHFAASGTMDASMEAELVVKVEGELSDLGLDELKSHTPKVKKQLWASQEWALPTEWIGVIPVEESVQMYLNAQCSVSFSGFGGGELHVVTGASATSTVTGGIDYAQGQWTPSDGASLDATGSLEITDGASEKANCSLVPAIALRFYDVFGPELGIASGLSFVVSQPQASQGGIGDSTWSAFPELTAYVQGNVSVLDYSTNIGKYVLYDHQGTPIAGSGK